MRRALQPFVMALLVAIAADVEAHVGDRVFAIPEISDGDLMEIDLHDGSIADWEEVLGDPTLTPLDFGTWEGGVDPSPYDPSDMDYRMWLCWTRTSGQLICAVEAFDDDYIPYGGGGLHETFRYDLVDLVVDGDHSGGQYLFPSTDDDDELNTNRQAQYYRSAPEAPDSRSLEYAGAGNDWVVWPPYADAGGGVLGQSPGIWVVEFCVTPFDDLIWDKPSESRRSELYAGKVIGLNLNVFDMDGDTAEGENTYHRLSPGAQTYMNADSFVDAVLLGTGGLGSEVGSVTWGRIKASFR